MLAGGRSVPIVGRVCMDLTMLDVGGASGLHAGDEVVLFGRQGESFISVDEVASELGTIHYEVVTTISERVPRVYLT
jgi:alanine racemase